MSCLIIFLFSGVYYCLQINRSTTSFTEQWKNLALFLLLSNIINIRQFHDVIGNDSKVYSVPCLFQLICHFKMTAGILIILLSIKDILPVL